MDGLSFGLEEMKLGRCDRVCPPPHPAVGNLDKDSTSFAKNSSEGLCAGRNFDFAAALVPCPHQPPAAPTQATTPSTPSLRNGSYQQGSGQERCLGHQEEARRRDRRIQPQASQGFVVSLQPSLCRRSKLSLTTSPHLAGHPSFRRELLRRRQRCQEEEALDWWKGCPRPRRKDRRGRRFPEGRGRGTQRTSPGRPTMVRYVQTSSFTLIY